MSRQRVMSVALAGLLVAGLAGCTPGARETVPYTTSEVTLEVGETLVVDFGEVNPSIGDSWELTTRPDADVLSKGEAVHDDGGEELPPGSGQPLAWEFTAEGPGTTTIGFTYSYRGDEGDPEGRTEDPNPLMTVTVE